MKPKKTNVKALICILLATSVAMLYGFMATQLSIVQAQEEPEIIVYLEPSSIVFTPENATLGQLFNVTVWINSTAPFNLMMWQVCLSFDDSILTFTRGWPNMSVVNWDPDYVFYGQTGMAVDPEYYTASGSPIGEPCVMLGHTLLSDLSVTEAKKVCCVEFNITAVPDGILTCTLGITNDQTFFYNTMGQLTVTLVDGSYTFIPEFSLVNLLILMLIITSAMVVGAKIRTQKRHSL